MLLRDQIVLFIYVDDVLVMSQAKLICSSVKFIARTKHIDDAHLWIEQEVSTERIKVHVHYVNSEDPDADKKRLEMI